jgi:hypothetical protein
MTRPARLFRRVALVALVFASSAAFAATTAHDLTGKWTFSVVTANGTGTPTVTLKQDSANKLTGTYESNALGSRTLDGRVYGDSMSFVLSMSGGAGEGVVLTYSARIVTADSLNGYVDFAGQGGAEFTAVRQK